MKLNKVNLFILCILVLSVLNNGCQKKKEAENYYPVEVIKAKSGSMNDSISFTGTLTTDFEVNLNSKVAGKISKIYVQEGEKVTKGQTLIVLENLDLSAGVQKAQKALQASEEQYRQIKLNRGSGPVNTVQAQKTLKIAEESYKQAVINMDLQEKEFNRSQNLYNEGAISKQQYDAVEARYQTAKSQMDSAKLNLEQYREGLRTSQVNETQSNAIGLANIEQAKAGLQMAEAELDNAIITAPFDGVVSRKNCALGQVVSAGGSGFLIQVVNNSSVFFEGNVSETAVTKIKKGQPCMVEVYALKKFFKGKVDSISESSDPSSRSLKVRIEMLNGHIRLLSGLAANADIAVNNYKGIVVPAYILRNINDQYYIAVPEDNKAVFKKVKLLFKDEDNAVIGGISPDQPIIARGVESLNNGDPIKEIQNNQE